MLFNNTNQTEKLKRVDEFVLVKKQLAFQSEDKGKVPKQWMNWI